MESNNYIGSFAQENVVFQTTVVERSAFGDNFKRVMIFTEQTLIADTSALAAVEGSDSIKVATVTADTYASIATGILQSWLTDLFVNGNLEEAYLVINGTSTLTSQLQEDAYDLLKAYAYWKTVCVPATSTAALDDARFNALAVTLADLCAVDKQVLSGPVLAPLSTVAASGWSSDARYTALKDKFVFMSYHPDATHNAALYSVGLALSLYNSSGTPVGNSLDMTKSNNMTSSNASRTVRDAMKDAYVQSWKPVGDNSAYVAAIGDKALNGDVISANWIVAYVTYMTKARIAILMTAPNFYRNNENYQQILNIMMGYINKFTGRLVSITCTAPSFETLPASAADELVIPNAWEATYVDHIRKVTISGTLYIGE